MDDFENDANVRNPQLVKQGKEYLQQAVLGSTGPGYCFIMVGNLFDHKSILSQLIAEKDEETGEPLYISRVYQAILDEGTPEERPLWPGVWSLERLKAKRKKMGSVAFNREMMNLCGAEDSPFREEWFRFYSREEVKLPPMLVATFCDPSAKKGENNDFKAVITVGLDRAEMRFFILHAWIRHATIGEMFAACYDQKDSYDSKVVGIEENMFQDFLHEAIQNYAIKVGRYLPWKGVTHKTQKEARIIGTLSYLVEHQKIQFEKGHSDQDRLREQLVYVLNKNVNDDGPDALEGAVSLLQSGSFEAADVQAEAAFDTYRSRREGGYRVALARMR